MSPLKAIRAKCLDCSGGSATEARECPCKGCELYPYRFGKRPNSAPRVLSEQHRAALASGRERARARKEAGENPL